MNIALFSTIQIFLSIVLIVLVFMQSSGQDESRGNIMMSVKFQKRGWERTLFMATIITMFLFIISSIIQTLI